MPVKVEFRVHTTLSLVSLAIIVFLFSLRAVFKPVVHSLIDIYVAVRFVYDWAGLAAITGL